mgnify:CR=1 FL=1
MADVLDQSLANVFERGLTDAQVGETAGTRLTYAVKAQIGGKLAQIGSRLIDGTARKMADDFANLDALGLILDSDPRQTTQAGQLQGKAAPQPVRSVPPSRKVRVGCSKPMFARWKSGSHVSLSEPSALQVSVAYRLSSQISAAVSLVPCCVAGTPPVVPSIEPSI